MKMKVFGGIWVRSRSSGPPTGLIRAAISDFSPGFERERFVPGKRRGDWRESSAPRGARRDCDGGRGLSNLGTRIETALTSTALNIH